MEPHLGNEIVPGRRLRPLVDQFMSWLFEREIGRGDRGHVQNRRLEIAGRTQQRPIKRGAYRNTRPGHGSQQAEQR